MPLDAQAKLDCHPVQWRGASHVESFAPPMAAPGSLSTHVLDTARGLPAAGVPLRLERIAAGGARELVAEAVTNAGGRTDEPLVAAGALVAGVYELTFSVGAHLVAGGAAAPFYDVIAVRFTVSDPAAGLHVPLLLGPYSYSTYRGS